MKSSAAAHEHPLLPDLFAGLLGAFLGLALLKFGNPPIMEKWTTAPTDIYEFIIASPWPIAWGYRLLTLVGIVGLFVARWSTKLPRWLLALPLAWFFWQFVATTQSLSARLSNPALAHFAACLACFYLGVLSLSRVKRMQFFWAGLLVGFALVVAAGWQQHFGGLEATRRYFYLYIYPQAKELPPEYLRKLASNRIFSTLFYPNALAGVLLLLLPPMLGLVWKVRGSFTPPALWFLGGLAALPSLACLYWSGSKGGWLLMLVLAVVALLQLPLGRNLKLGIIAALLLCGLAGFFVKYSSFFQKGATSVGARFDYWRAAVQTAAAHPFFGAGPGTFSITYEKLKRPESEMSRMVHNDYLEQASDSGIPGFLIYSGFILCALIYSRPRSRNPNSNPPAGSRGNASKADVTIEWLTFAVWLGLLGWALQGFVEFGLYLPALSWPAFTLLGWLIARRAQTSTVS